MSIVAKEIGMQELASGMYASPQGHVPLRTEGASVVGAGGAIRFPVCHGIPQFLELSPSESPEEAERLDVLNEVAIQRGWRAALAEVYGEGSGMYQYVTDSSRANYLELLPLGPDSVVLEIGPGLGQFTSRIAGASKFVHALEVVLGQARFAQERCCQEGADNVRVACGGDTCWLPYADCSFDVAVCNLVFEWCASRNQGERPELTQERLLQEFKRVLKPGGALYLATKNRFALHYLIGKRDEHAYNMRFGNALPRWLMRWALARRGRDRPQGVLYSHGTLRSMLGRAGFGDIRSFWAVPEMRFPERLIPTDSRSIREARKQGGFSQGSMRSTRLLMPLVPAGLVHYVTPGLAFLAVKSA